VIDSPPIPIQNPLSLTGKRWILPPQGTSGDSLIEKLATERGVDINQAPSWGNLTDPMALGEMRKACDRIQKAIDLKEAVGIIGDYDADGITGTAQLVRFFRRRGIEPEVILPHRQKHGYGVKKEFIDELNSKNVTLIITVDTGISHAEEISHAKSLGIDVIITDHHTLHGDKPEAIIIHPRVDCDHPNSDPAGSGVAFTFVRALEGDEWEGKNVDVALAAIGTVADIMPLTGENRTIVQLGLEAMTNGSGSPVFDLAKSTVKNGEPITATHIGFRIAPRINAAGRLADPVIALNGLLEGSENLERLHTLNTQRQEATRQMMEVAEKLVSDAPVLIIKSPMFHPGIIGLIAGRLTEKFGKPSIVACEAGDEVTCSLRSIPQYHIADALNRVSENLETFGGHREAAGCTLKNSSWENFTEAMLHDIKKQIPDHDFAPSLQVDVELEGDALTLDLVKSLKLLEPFGAGNLEPFFLLRNQKIGWAKQVGSDGAHLQCSIGSRKAIGFRLGHLLDNLPDQVDVVCRLGIDTWGGAEKVQIVVEDFALPIKQDKPVEEVKVLQ